jgi:hypothetical protein
MWYYYVKQKWASTTLQDIITFKRQERLKINIISSDFLLFRKMNLIL